MELANNRNRIKNWEYENQLRLAKAIVKTLEFTQDLSLNAMKWAVTSTSFLMYLIYGVSKLLILCARSFFVGPQLIMHVSPEKKCLERYEFEKVSFLQPPRF